jgi:hypothetical protein
MGNPDRIRERMEEQKDSEQMIWVSFILLDTYIRYIDILNTAH